MKTSMDIDSDSKNAKSHNWFFGLWLALAILVIFGFTILGTAWVVRLAINGNTRLTENQIKIVMALSEFPGLVRNSINEVRAYITEDPVALLMARGIDQPNLIRRFPAAEDSGYLLLAGVDPELKRSDVRLIQISNGTVVSRWVPDWSYILKQTKQEGSSKAMQAYHPVLLQNGDIIFNTFRLLVRISPCSNLPIWMLDEKMNHSVELDPSGDVWVESFSQDGFSDNPWLRDRTNDDALARVSIDGKIIDKRSFVRILRDNGLEVMLSAPYYSDARGGRSIKWKADPLHLNEIQIAQKDSRYWQLGDLLISARNLSTVFLYRPSSGKIIWHKTGPWMSQHSADFVDNHRISVFDNHVVAEVNDDGAFLAPGDINRVIVYDFDTKTTYEPFAALLAEARPKSKYAGRARVLPDGGLFMEDLEAGRHLRFTKNKLLWSRINDYDGKHIGAVSWSRYLTAEEAKAPLRALASRNCSISMINK